MASISLCMIVKNEEAVLGRCLDSIRQAVEEIIIVDTGSSDRTREIAARYTDKIYDFPWKDDFSSARNFSFAQATMDFVMWLDADDVLTEADREAFLQMKQRELAQTDAVMMRYHTAFDEDGRPVFSFYRERLVRRSVPHVWKGRVHEVLIYSGRTFYAKNVAVTHRSVKTSYSDRNLKIYEKQAAEESLEPRDQFYYGRELYYHRRYAQAGDILRSFLREGRGWLENNIEACKILSWCYQANNEDRWAFYALTASFYYDAPRAELCCEIGNLFLKWQNYRTAIFWFELARVLPRNDQSGAFLSEDTHGYLPCLQLCVCYDRLGEYEKAREYNRLAAGFRPHSEACQKNEIYFQSRL